MRKMKDSGIEKVGKEKVKKSGIIDVINVPEEDFLNHILHQKKIKKSKKCSRQ